MRKKPKKKTFQVGPWFVLLALSIPCIFVMTWPTSDEEVIIEFEESEDPDEPATSRLPSKAPKKAPRLTGNDWRKMSKKEKAAWVDPRVQRRKSRALTKCLNEATKGGAGDKVELAELAATCLLMM